MTDHRLHDAAASDDLTEIARLLAEGVDVDARDPEGRTPVIVATVEPADGGRPGARRGRGRRGSYIRDDRLDNPFLYAGAEGFLDILRIVNEAGADPSISNRYGSTRCIPACERGRVDVVRYLLHESDVDVDHVNNLGWTGLLEAIILADGDAAHQEIVRLLLENGADPELADRGGITPLAHARAQGRARGRRAPRCRRRDALRRRPNRMPRAACRSGVGGTRGPIVKVLRRRSRVGPRGGPVRRRSSTPRPPERPGDHRSAALGPSRPPTRTVGRTSATNRPPGGRKTESTRSAPGSRARPASSCGPPGRP